MLFVLWVMACIQTELYEKRSEQLPDSCGDTASEQWDTGL